MEVALYQPDIAGNVGTIMRLCACWGVPLNIVMPCGFPFGDKQLRRAAMDYGASAQIRRHAGFDDFADHVAASGARIVLLSSKAQTTLPAMQFEPSDILLFGSESAGVPAHVHDAAAMSVRIPMLAGFRSLNLAVSAGIALGKALEQTGLMPE